MGWWSYLFVCLHLSGTSIHKPRRRQAVRQCAVRTAWKKKEDKNKHEITKYEMGAHVFCLTASLPLHFHVFAGGMCSGLRVTRLASLRPKHIRPCERDDVGQYLSILYEAKCDCVFRHVCFIFLSPHQGNTQHHSYLLVCLAPTDPFWCCWFCQRGCSETVREWEPVTAAREPHSTAGLRD